MRKITTALLIPALFGIALCFTACQSDDFQPDSNTDNQSTSISGIKSAKPVTPIMKKFSSQKADWKKVEAAERKGRPKSAIEALEPICSPLKMNKTGRRR